MSRTREEFSMNREELGYGIKFIMAGQITTITSNEFEYKLNREIDCGKIFINLNMARVTLLTSTGIRVILKTYKKLEKMGGKLQIEYPSEAVKNTLGLVAMDQMLVIRRP